jgi:hypothetical protein
MTETSAAPNNRAIIFSSKPSRERSMGKLNAKKRNALPGKDFAGPDRSYPDEDLGHARAALSRVSANGSPKVKKEVRAKVHRDWPGIKVKGLKKAGKISDKQAEKRGW